jgi:hypothetical protein
VTVSYLGQSAIVVMAPVPPQALSPGARLLEVLTIGPPVDITVTSHRPGSFGSLFARRVHEGAEGVWSIASSGP